jgi:hypothetical protein
MTLPMDSTLREARDFVQARLVEGVRCPCCTQFAKVYKRKLNSGQAWALILVYRRVGREWCHITQVDPSLAGNGGDISKLRYWGLVEEADERREDGGRAGWWRVTGRGERFVLGQIRLPKYVRLYDSQPYGLYGDSISIRDALGSRFDYNELMNDN